MLYPDICIPLLNTPHTLIAGTTGSGKSVLMNDCVCSIISERACVVVIDLKRVELAQYRRSRYCIDYCTEPERVVSTLDSVIALMERRYKTMDGRMSEDYDLFVVVDELADTVSNKKVLERLIKIGRLGRAARIHLLCATQDPSRRTLRADLMQNFTCTVALRCRSAIESRQIIGVPGAEKLPLYGQAYRWDARGVTRFDVPLTPDNEIDRLISETSGPSARPNSLKQSILSLFA